MATRRYKVSVGETEFQIVEEVGPAVNSDTVELLVELAPTHVNVSGGTTRSPLKQEILDCIDEIKNHIIKGNWPPATP